MKIKLNQNITVVLILIIPLINIYFLVNAFIPPKTSLDKEANVINNFKQLKTAIEIINHKQSLPEQNTLLPVQASPSATTNKTILLEIENGSKSADQKLK